MPNSLFCCLRIMAISLEQKVSLAVLFIGLIMLVVTLAEPYWFKGQGAGGDMVHMGLWKYCLLQKDCISLNGSPSWITGPEVLECISLSCALGALALSFRMIFHKTRIVCILAAALAGFAGLMGLVGALVFNKKMASGVAEWCFYLNIVSDVFLMASGLVLAVHVFRMVRGYSSI